MNSSETISAGSDGIGSDSRGFGGETYRNVDLENSEYENVDFSESKFLGGSLSGSRFINCDLSGVYFRKVEMENVEFTSSNLQGTEFEGVSLNGCSFENAELWRSDLSGENLEGVDFSGALISDADLSECYSPAVDFEGVVLEDSDLTDIHAPSANFANANIRGVDFTGGILTSASLVGCSAVGGIFRGTDLSGADLSRADLRETVLEDATVNSGTELRDFARPASDQGWGGIAESYHNIKELFSDHGLDHKARRSRWLERETRQEEAIAEDRYMSYLAGISSRYLTGYGTKISYIGAWSGAIILTTMLWYSLFHPGNWEGGSLYYSVVTFVTSPPHPPNVSGGVVGVLTRTIVLFETYFGTVLIVLSGYVLSNRDRI